MHTSLMMGFLSLPIKCSSVYPVQGCKNKALCIESKESGVHIVLHPYSSRSVTERSLRPLIAIVSLDLFTALIAIVSSKFIHLPRERVNEGWKIHFH